MKKIMILAVAAALLGIAAPNTMAQVPGSSQPSSSSSSSQQDDDLNQSPSSTTTQPGTSGSTGTSGTSGSSSQHSTSGSQSGTSGTQSGSQSGTSGSSGSMGTSGSSSSSMEFKDEVKTSDLPAAVTRSINEKYPGYKTEKAYRGSDGTYKIKVSKGDETQTLFFDERGEVVKMKK